MKLGDMIKVNDCTINHIGVLDLYCQCFFCSGKSNRIGVVLGPAPANSWDVMFDCGMWTISDFEEARGEVKVISEAR